MDEMSELVGLFREAAPFVVLTGAGVSTESGIPDFRSPGTGLYNFIDPMEYLSVWGMQKNAPRFWKHFKEMRGPILDANPNAGHLALARLEEGGWVSHVITQNIDGLHYKAGSRNVLEIHGHLRTARCMACEERMDLTEALDQLPERDVPQCPECGADLRPDVVLFGDVPEEYPRAMELVEASPLLMVVGSSLSVSPANMLLHGAGKLVIINRDPTASDRLADIVIQGSAGEILQDLTERL
ncbi:MAG: SIR2 family NAD-dependent protein deacylase [Candidatus Sumerlaeia bacterium]